MYIQYFVKLCAYFVFFVVISSDLDFYHKGLKGIHKDHKDCMCLYFNILINEN